MYIGSILEDKVNTFCFNQETKKIEKQEINFISGLFKIFDEILVNSMDHHIRIQELIKNKSKDDIPVKNIKVNIDKESGKITIFNDGTGIEVYMHNEYKIYIPELIFGNMFTSTNYDDTEERLIGGQNGIGNIFSKKRLQSKLLIIKDNYCNS